MARKKLALDDDQVVAIVEAINASQGMSVYQLSRGLVANHSALASLAERYDAIQADHREQMRAEYRRDYANSATTYRDGSARDRERDLRISATGIALKLGHTYPAIQGRAYECSSCGATGRAEESLNGAIFKERCK